MQILVTGGAGFIGSHVCDRLVEAGHNVVAVDNFLLGREANIAHLAGQPLFQFEKVDVADSAQLDPIVEANSFECVFHLAANSDISRSRDDPSIDFHNTFKTTYVVLEAMRKARISQIVFASTSAVYGEAPGRIPEDYGPLLPISHYGASKLASEAYISSYSNNYAIRAWIARFPNVVGERATHGAVFDFAKKLKVNRHVLEVLGNGAQIKPYLHVGDLVTAMLLAWEKMTDPVNVFNVGGTTRTTAKRIAEIVVEESGSPAQIVYTGGDRGWIGDVPAIEFDTTKITQLGWHPKLDSESAVRRAAHWIVRNV